MTRLRSARLLELLPGFRQHDGHHAREMFHGASVSLLLRLGAGGIAFGFQVVLARALGATGMGMFVLATTLVTVATVLSRFGLDNVLLRRTAAGAAAQDWSSVLGVYGRAMRLAFVAGGFCTLLLWGISPWLANTVFHKPDLAEPLRWMALAVIPTTLLMLHSELLKGLKRVALASSVESLLVPFFALVGLWLVPTDRLDVRTAVWVYMVAGMITAAIGYLMWRRMIQGCGIAGDGPSLSELLRSCLPLLGATLMSGVIIPWAPVIFLGAWGSSSEVGIFSVANRLAMLTSLVLIAVNSVAAPKFAALHHQGEFKCLGDTARGATRLMTFAAAPVLLVFVILPERVLQLFGNEFIQGSTILAILAIGQFVNVATGSVGYLLTMSGHDRQLWSSTFVSAAINIVLCLTLIPAHGAVGAAIAAATSVAVSKLVNVYSVWRCLGISTLPLPFVPRFLANPQR